jgi:hypothetical protein
MTLPKTDTRSPAITSGHRTRRTMDPEVPVRYIRDNFRPDDRLAVVIIDKQTHRTVQRISTADRIARPDFQAWLRHENASRREIYIGMNSLKEGCHTRTKADIAEIRHVYLDFDDNGAAALKALAQRDDLPESNYVLNTSPDRYQVVWKVEGFQSEEAERLMRHLVRESGADPAATDSSRVLRVPGFISYKHSTPFLVQAESRSPHTYRPEQFPKYPTEDPGARAAGTNPREANSSTSPSHVSQSERDWAYAKRSLARGEGPDKVLREIAAFRAGEKPDPQAYAARTVAKAMEALNTELDRSPDQFDSSRGL